jgi:peptide/nickel transport system permease protein
MNSYYIKRTFRSVFTLWVVVTLTFGMIRLLPGGPLVRLRAQLTRQGVDPNEIDGIIESYQNLRPDEPLYVQYVDYVSSLLVGDLGQSFRYGEPVAALVGDALPWTVFVMVTATVLMYALGILWGAVMAYNEGSRFDSVSSALSILFSTVPFYVFAIFLIIIFGHQLELFPTRGRTSVGVQDPYTIEFAIDVVRHATLPILSIIVTQVGLQALAMRGNSIQLLGEDFVRVARLRGLTDNRIAARYVGRNAILPMYTGFLTLIGFNIGGSVILEEVFTYPGIGYYMFKALEGRDYPLMMAVFLVITSVLVVALFVADLTYSKIDPRVQTGDSSEAY